MNQLIRVLCVICASVCMSGPLVANPVLSLVPSTSKIHPPESFFVDVIISGMQSGGFDALLGAFDLTILFNPDIVSLLTIGSTLGTGLGDPTDPLQTVVGADSGTPGSFRFFEVSLLEGSSTSCIFCIGPYLQDLQSDSFTLASLLFFSAGTPSGALFTNFRLPMDQAVLSDANGNAITDFTIRNASVNIDEPSGTVLLATALLLLIALGRKAGLKAVFMASR